ncbi:hypothetical protein MTHERMOG20_22390 [Moorella thermoacetica]|nr:hypothetical protein MTHERMOG20_22390 [Moorella thermoacetica]
MPGMPVVADAPPLKMKMQVETGVGGYRRKATGFEAQSKLSEAEPRWR